MLKFTNQEKTAAMFNGAYFVLASPEDWSSIGDTPTREAVIAWLAEGNTPEPADLVPNPRIAEIKAELVSLDFKRIRPIAEGDTEYLAELNTQMLALRAELKLLTTPADVEAIEEPIIQPQELEPVANPTSEEI